MNVVYGFDEYWQKRKNITYIKKQRAHNSVLRDSQNCTTNYDQ